MKEIKILGKQHGYTIIENPDKDLVEKIKALSVDETDLTYDGTINGQKFTIDKKLNKNQLLCKKNDSLEYFLMLTSDLEKRKKDFLLRLINDTYPAVKYSYLIGLKYHFGENYYGSINGHKTTQLSDGRSFDSFEIEEWHYHNYDRSYSNERIEFGYAKGKRSINMSFDFDGNILIYDNYFDFSKMDQENFKTKEELFEESVNELKKFIGTDEILHHGDKWYTDKFMYTINYNESYNRVSVVTAPHKLTLSNGVVTYKGYGPTQSRPKSAVSVDPQTLIDAYKLKVEELWKQS